MSKGKGKRLSDMDAAKADLEDNLLLLEASVTKLSQMLDEDVIPIQEAGIKLHLVREQQKIVLKLIDKYVPHLRTASLKYEVAIQLQRKMDLIEQLAFIEEHTKSKLDTPGKPREPGVSSDSFRFVLPKRELPKFDGDVRNWLSFWAAFKEIHEDKGLSGVEKFQYLQQAMIHDTPAYKVVYSFPVNSANYLEAIKCLSERFGRKKTLIKVYVRDLLKLVVENSSSTKSSDFVELVTSLDSQIRNLGQLGVTANKYGELLYPVVESCIPESVLDGYLRMPGAKEELDDLMLYLRDEVRRNMDTSLAQCHFRDEEKFHKKYKSSSNNHQPIKTAAGLVNASASRNNSCVFCGKSGHNSRTCFVAKDKNLQWRKEALKSARACFRCFKVSHVVGECQAKFNCANCDGNHHMLMCNRMGHGKPNVEVKEPKRASDGNSESKLDRFSDGRNEESHERHHPAETDDSVKKSSMSNVVPRNEVLLQTLTVLVHGPNGTKKARAAFDSLSQSSYIKNKLASELGLKVVGHERQIHQIFGGESSPPMEHSIYEVTISGLQERDKLCFQFCGIKNICGKIDSLPSGVYYDECLSKGIKLTDICSVSADIDVLIGADFGDELKLGGEFIRLDSGPVAIHTRLGWVVSGRLAQQKRLSSAAMVCLSRSLNENEVSKLWELEAIGIEDPVTSKSREELEKSALTHFEKTVSQDESGRYSVHLPWLEDHPPLLDNRAAAVRRLESTTRKLKQQGFLDDYDKVFKSWLEEGIIENVSHQSSGKYYLPHRAVVKENSTTPLRPVFDASAKSVHSPSLNDCLEKGPNLLEEIPAILNRFRMDKVGVVADIKKAFLQMKVIESDRDYLSFLWWKDINKCDELLELRHARVVFGVTSSPFLLGAVLKHHIGNYKEFPETCKKLINSFCVDNSVISFPSLQVAKQFEEEASKILSAGLFDLRGWEYGPSNEEKLLSVLGLLWNTLEDVLMFDTKHIEENINIPATKRNVYKLLNMLYDPLGFASPFTVLLKILLKKICVGEKVGWDDELSSEFTADFESWKKQLTELRKVKVPRFVSANCKDAVKSLHCFSDASMNCFACCVYLRVDFGTEVKVYLLQSKTRVSPKKCVSIPRLELLSCVISARLATTLIRDMQWNTTGFESASVFYWCDSSTALAWIRKNENWATWVSNRVKEIRSTTDPEFWRHVPGTHNPADLPSRGCSMKKILESNWWSGPTWLYGHEDTWPKNLYSVDDTEVNKEKKKSVISAVNVISCDKFEERLLRQGNYIKMLRVLAFVLRFVNKARKEETAEGDITAEEVDASEKYLLRYIQQSSADFLEKIPTQEDEFGLIRLKSRLVLGGDEEGFMYPVVLPGKHPFVKQLIMWEHELHCHAGVQFLQSSLRERFWITKSRRSIRNVIMKCAVCRVHNSKRAEVPEAPLPSERLKNTNCFSVVGVDLAGPLFVEKGKKVWIVLFTCAVYRAIHLELVSSLSTEMFIMAFRKFVARRGRPSVVYSDNGTNFTGCSNLLKSVNWNEVMKYATVQRIQWRFNPPSAAWWGGWWERLVGLVKQLLRRVLGSRLVKQTHLEVLLVEVEAIMNDRPLTYLSDDHDDLRSLTPSCFLRDLPIAVLPEVEVSTGASLRVNWKKLHKMKEELRNRFRKEYLGQLVHRGKARKATILNPGDVVLVEMENQKKIDWPMGIILETFPGKDENIRVARIKTNKGTMVRPLQRLFPLEVHTPRTLPAVLEDNVG